MESSVIPKHGSREGLLSYSYVIQIISSQSRLSFPSANWRCSASQVLHQGKPFLLFGKLLWSSVVSASHFLSNGLIKHSLCFYAFDAVYVFSVDITSWRIRWTKLSQYLLKSSRSAFIRNHLCFSLFVGNLVFFCYIF